METEQQVRREARGIEEIGERKQREEEERMTKRREEEGEGRQTQTVELSQITREGPFLCFFFPFSYFAELSVMIFAICSFFLILLRSFLSFLFFFLLTKRESETKNRSSEVRRGWQC